MDAVELLRRVDAADAVRKRWVFPESDEDQETAQRWLDSVDQSAYVGSRHHTVPRFLLKRWADKSDQVRAYHRIESRHGIENIADLATTDFYTVINEDGSKSSAIESIMGRVDNDAKPHIDAILNRFARPAPLGVGARLDLAQFAAFQSIRTARQRRELELHAEWYAKTMAADRLPQEELARITVVPHQNETIFLAAKSAEDLLPFFVCRPLAIVDLGLPLLYMCDEPVVLNVPGGELHTPDCFLTDAEIEQRLARQMRKVKKRRRDRAKLRGRTVHFSSTRPTGHGVADEILLAISPGTALLWGPLADVPQAGPVERIRLSQGEAMRFATMANEAMCAQALDWIITRPADEAFLARVFPPTGPLMRVCDGTNAASLALNTAPARFRPHRLWTPEQATG
jgi:hypothetical protein